MVGVIAGDGPGDTLAEARAEAAAAWLDGLACPGCGSTWDFVVAEHLYFTPGVVTLRCESCGHSATHLGEHADLVKRTLS